MNDVAMHVDHLMWAAPDLDPGIDLLAALTGCRAIPGGAHPGNGTRNALLGVSNQLGMAEQHVGRPLGPGEAGRNRCYLEIIAPDPAQVRTKTMGAELEQLEHPKLRTWAVAATDIDSIAAELVQRGVSTEGPRAMSRRTPRGELLQWRLLFARAPGLGGVMPFFIDWGSSPHPSLELTQKCRLKMLQLTMPADSAVFEWLKRIEGVDVVEGDGPRMCATIATPKGVIELR